MEEHFVYLVLSIVEEIPYGKVATYQQIARLAGRDKNARLVARILANANRYGNYPCHRVVNSKGRTAPNWEEQRLLLEEEGIQFQRNGCVDLAVDQWKQ